MMDNREIDRLVHDKIMGQKGIASRYTEEIGKAWQVFEQLEKSGLVRVSNGDGDSKDCVFVPYGHQQGQVYLKAVHAMADSYPLAICLAALRAVGVEDLA